MQSAYTSGWHTVNPIWIFAIIKIIIIIINKINKCTELGSTMKELIIIWKETFLREPVTMTHLTILLTSRERSPATIFVQHGWDSGWGGHLSLELGQTNPSLNPGGLSNGHLLSC